LGGGFSFAIGTMSSATTGRRQVPPRTFSLAKQQQKKQADEWHAKLVTMDESRSRRLAEKMKSLMDEQQVVLKIAVRALAQNKVIESFVENLWEAQRGLADEMKMGYMSDEAEADDWHPDTASTNTFESSFADDHHHHHHQDNSMNNSNVISQSASSMERTTRLMVRRIQKMGVMTLQQVLERLRRMSTTLMEQHNELQQIGRTAIKALQESQVKVQQAWEKYLKDATTVTSPPESQSSDSDSGHTPPPSRGVAKKSSFKGNKGEFRSSLKGGGDSVSKGVARRSSFKSEPIRGLSRKSSIKRNERDIRESIKDDPSKRIVHRNNSLRAMENVADLTASLPSADIWLSEWSYRAHVMEQVTLWEGATKRMNQLFKSIKETETLRRFQLRQDLMMIVQNQQKLSVNLEAAAAVGLVEYWEKRQQFATVEEGNEQDGDGEGATNSTVGNPNAEEEDKKGASAPRPTETPQNSLTLPSLTKSGFVTLTTLVKRLDMNDENPILSMIVMTTDGVLYFFDLPADSKVEFNSSTSLAQAWEAVLAAEFKRQMNTMTSKQGTDFVIIVPPPMPSMRFVLAQCSVEMTNVDCVAHFCVPESQGDDFRMELASTRLQIAFIDAFHACKFQDDRGDMMGDTDVSENVSDVSDTEQGEADEDVSFVEETVQVPEEPVAEVTAENPNQEEEEVASAPVKESSLAYPEGDKGADESSEDTLEGARGESSSDEDESSSDGGEPR